MDLDRLPTLSWIFYRHEGSHVQETWSHESPHHGPVHKVGQAEHIARSVVSDLNSGSACLTVLFTMCVFLWLAYKVKVRVLPEEHRKVTYDHRDDYYPCSSQARQLASHPSQSPPAAFQSASQPTSQATEPAQPIQPN